jgi:hypothetical protein
MLTDSDIVVSEEYPHGLGFRNINRNHRKRLEFCRIGHERLLLPRRESGVVETEPAEKANR